MYKSLIFKLIDPASVEIALFIDTGFVTNKYLTSQLGFVMFSTDKGMNTNTIHYGSVKSKRATTCVLAAQMLAMVQGYDV